MAVLELDTPTSETLVSLSDDDFRNVINKAVRGDLDEQTVEVLKDPAVIDRTISSLIVMKKNVEGQLAAKRADHQRTKARSGHSGVNKTEEQYRGWRAGALRFKSSIEEWLENLRHIKSTQMPTMVNQVLTMERNSYVVSFERLRQAIIEHRDHVCNAACDDVCQADVRLWSSIT